jgi:hypothetical protein
MAILALDDHVMIRVPVSWDTFTRNGIVYRYDQDADRYHAILEGVDYVFDPSPALNGSDAFKTLSLWRRARGEVSG